MVLGELYRSPLIHKRNRCPYIYHSPSHGDIYSPTNIEGVSHNLYLEKDLQAHWDLNAIVDQSFIAPVVVIEKLCRSIAVVPALEGGDLFIM